MRSRAIVAAVVCSAWLPGPSSAYVPERTPALDRDASMRRVLAQPGTRGTAGMVLVRGGRVVWARNADRAMIPASLMKLLTTTAAIERFGPDHRFPTRVMTRGRGSVGDVWLVGGGDPTLSTERFRRYRFEPKPTDVIRRPAFAGGSPTIEQLAAAVARAGVTAVTGRVVVDDSLFDAARVQRGWLSRYTGADPEVGFISALTLNEGKADLEGRRVYPDPAVAAGQALASALRARGVAVAGETARGRAEAAATEVARVESPPVSEIVDFVNRYSINYEAELLLKSLGAHHGGGGSTTRGVTVVREVLGELGIPTSGLVMHDGSGLSRTNRVRPRTIASLLDVIRTRRATGWNELRASIPVAGMPGTLERRLGGSPTGGNLRGKGALLRGVRGLGGWVTARDGVPLVYVALFNGVASASALTAPLDLLGLLLARSPHASAR